MKIKVGIIGSAAPATTVTLYLDPVLDADQLQNVTDKNKERVGVAIARKALDCGVFPIEITL